MIPKKVPSSEIPNPNGPVPLHISETPSNNLPNQKDFECYSIAGAGIFHHHNKTDGEDFAFAMDNH